MFQGLIRFVIIASKACSYVVFAFILMLLCVLTMEFTRLHYSVYKYLQFNAIVQIVIQRLVR